MAALETSDLRSEAAIAVDAVAAGMCLAADSVVDHGVAIKDGRDVVTAADTAVESTIRNMLTAALGMPSVGEEQGGETPPDGSGYWLIDPICGTRNDPR